MINKEYKLKESNHFETTSNKTKIVVGNSYASDMKHFDRWVNRIHGKSKNTTPYSIDLDGVIYEHYDPKYDSLFTNNEIIDRSIIGVTLVNEGYINIDNEKKLKLTWNNDIYKRKAKLINKKWRDKELWAPYSKKQLNSLVDLCKELSSKFNIPLQSIGHNVEVMNPNDFEGIMFRSNFSKFNYDVSPAFDFNEFDKKIKKK